MVEALFAHGFDGFAAGRVGGDGGYGFEAEGGDGGALEGILLCDGIAAGDGDGCASCVGGYGWGWWEEIVGGEPVVVDKLEKC